MTEATAPDLREKIAAIVGRLGTFAWNAQCEGLESDDVTKSEIEAVDAILALLPAPAPLGEDGWPETLNELEREALKDDDEGWSITDVEIHVVLRLIAIARAAGGGE